ncbi:DUF488 domain-containing protein [Thiomonas sp. FB-Cd]|uniref:DUF488 domain-containing protein n=1 Tax=Thiomonas sp. FB-Cd TaxID=1158292 RepID=UPI0006901C05|nr:DUF488 family protein [Thiomonas sp. FB-Cd]
MARSAVDAGHGGALPPRLAIKRVYDGADASDGFRVLVDRLWPRGMGRDKARIDLWVKDLAPSDALRHWFDHDPAKWPEFAQRYAAELQANADALGAFEADLAKHEHVTLLYAARDERHNNAAALLAYLLRKRSA